MLRITLLLLFTAVIGCAAPVLLISIDGLRPDYITQADAHSIKAPHLRRFVANGAYAEGVTGVVPTITYPSHTSIVTGVSPAEHNILANVTFDPLLANFQGWYWYAQDIRVPTLWQAADRAGMVTASLNWPVTVGAKGVRYLIPEFARANTAEDRKLLAALSRPDGWFNELESKLGRYTNGSETTLEGDRIRTNFALEILASKKPGFMTIHLNSLDHIQHDTGPFSKAAAQDLEGLDELVGQLMDRAVKNDPAAVIAVVSDHGFISTDHRVNLMVPLIAQGFITPGKPEPRFGAPTIAEWKAFPWTAGGSAAIVLRRPEDTGTKDQVRRLLDELASKPENGIARILDADQLRKLGGYANATFLVELKPGYQTGNAFSGPLVTAFPGTGSHGYLPDRPEMRASFFLMGAGVAHKQLGVIDMRAIAPTLAALLHIQLPSAKFPPLDVSSTPAKAPLAK